MADFQQAATNYLQPAIVGDSAGKRFFPLMTASAKTDSLGVPVVIGNFSWIVPNVATSQYLFNATPIVQCSTNGLTNAVLAGLIVRETPSNNIGLGFTSNASIAIFDGEPCQYTTQSVQEFVAIGSVSGAVGVNSIVYANVVDGSIGLYATAPLLTVAVPTNYVVTGIFPTQGYTGFVVGQLIQISNTNSVAG